MSETSPIYDRLISQSKRCQVFLESLPQIPESYKLAATEALTTAWALIDTKRADNLLKAETHIGAVIGLLESAILLLPE